MFATDLQQRLTLTTAAGAQPDDLYAAIIGDPTLVTTMDGASTLTVKINDPLRVFLQQVDSPNEVKKATADIDGALAFSLAHVSKQDNTLTLIYEDALIAKLRAKTAKLVMKPGTLTYAAFIQQLASEAGVQADVDPTISAPAPRSLARSIGSHTTNSWQVIADLAARLGWRCFSNGLQIVVGSDAWLLKRGAPIPAFEFVAPVDRIDFTIAPNATTHAASLRVDTADWQSAPGDVVTITGAGPADGSWLVARWSRGLTSQGFSKVELIQAAKASAPGITIDALASHQPQRLTLDPMAAEVVRVEGTQIFAVPIGGDRAHPLGPCHGQKTKFSAFTAVTGVGGSPAVITGSEPKAMKRVPIKVGDTVLLIETAQGPWIVAVEE